MTLVVGGFARCSSSNLQACVVTDLLDGTGYSWYVEGVTDSGIRVDSETRTFRTDAAPSVPEIGSGDDGATQVPMSTTLSEGQSRDADGDPITYDITFRSVAGTLVHECPELASPSCSVSGLVPGQTYFASISASDGLLSASKTVSFTTRRPIVLIHGWNGDSGSWDGRGGNPSLRDTLTSAGFYVLDFTPTQGHPNLAYDTSSDAGGIAKIASTEVFPAVDAALTRAGFPAGEHFDIIAHSMGGLVSRWLIEHSGETITEAGITVRTPIGWNSRVGTLTMLATPNQGANYNCGSTSCNEMAPGSDFLNYLGYKAGTRAASYRALAGDADDVVPPANAGLDDVVPTVFHRVCHTAGYGFFCDYPIVLAPQTLTETQKMLAQRPG